MIENNSSFVSCGGMSSKSFIVSCPFRTLSRKDDVPCSPIFLPRDVPISTGEFSTFV